MIQHLLHWRVHAHFLFFFLFLPPVWGGIREGVDGVLVPASSTRTPSSSLLTLPATLADLAALEEPWLVVGLDFSPLPLPSSSSSFMNSARSSSRRFAHHSRSGSALDCISSMRARSRVFAFISFAD